MTTPEQEPCEDQPAEPVESADEPDGDALFDLPEPQQRRIQHFPF
jgi:hypothetical protein